MENKGLTYSAEIKGSYTKILFICTVNQYGIYVYQS